MAAEQRLGARATSPAGAALLTLLADAEQLAAALRDDPSALAPFADLPDPAALPTETVTTTGVAVGFDSWSHNFAGMLSMFLLFLALERAKGLLDERGSGTLQRLRLVPVPKSALLAATGLGTAMIALLVSALVYGVGMVFFGVAIRGSVAGFLAVLAAQALAVAGFALLLSGLGRTATQITNLGTFAILLMSFLGGATLPSFLMPQWVQSLSAFVPTYWATRGLAAMTWRGLPLAAAVAPALALVAFGLVLGTIGVRRFRWD
jgi:ABC-2 type transport system permease protein